METVYLETSVISYLTSPPSRDLVVAANQQLAHEWWDTARTDYELYVSKLVGDEVARGDPVQAAKRLALIHSITRLSVTAEATELANQFLKQSSLPDSALADAVHIAVATVYGMDYLLTWNCRHIANAHILKKLRSIARSMNYELPAVCTPLEILAKENEL